MGGPFSERARFIARSRLGVRYILKYLADALVGAHRLSRSPFKPVDVLTEITYACNLKCPTCFRWTSRPEEGELTREDWFGIITKLKGWLGSFNLCFSGGEPFLREDLTEIVCFASERGVLASAVSNGSLIDEVLARKIVDSGLDALTLSLNSLDPEVHDLTRGMSGSFDDVERAVKNLEERGQMRLTINTTVMRENLGELTSLVGFVKERGLDGINFQPLMEASALPIFDSEGISRELPKGTLYEERGAAEGTSEEAEEVFTELMRMKKDGEPINNSTEHLGLMKRFLKDPGDPSLLETPCRIGPKNFFIDPFGNVRICSLMEVVGNVRDSVPREIWNSDKARFERCEIMECRKPCMFMNCNFKSLDLGSRVERILRAVRR